MKKLLLFIIVLLYVKSYLDAQNLKWVNSNGIVEGKFGSLIIKNDSILYLGTGSYEYGPIFKSVDNDNNSMFLGTSTKGLFVFDSIHKSYVPNESFWLDSLNFKEINNMTNGVKKIWFSKDGSNFYTFENDNYFHIWDTESGRCKKEYYLSNSNITDIDYYEKDKLLSVSYREAPQSLTSYNTIFYDIENDSIIKIINPLKKVTLDNSILLDGLVKCVESKDKVIIFSNYQTNWDYWKESGIIGLYDIYSQNEVWGNKSLKSNKLILSDNEDILMVSGYEYFYRLQGDFKSLILFSNMDSSFTFWSLITGTTNDDISKSMDISFDSRYAAYSTSNNQINIVDISTHSILKGISNGFSDRNYTPQSIAFSNVTYDFYTCSYVKHNISDSAYNTYELRKWNINHNEPIDSLNFNFFESWQLAVSPDSKYLIGGSNKGRIRLWNLNMFKVTGIDEKNTTNVIVYPNPASDYIEIQLSESFKLSESYFIKIYNTYGQCVINYELQITNYDENIRIDVSQLPVGIYFLRIGNQVEKFVVLR